MEDIINHIDGQVQVIFTKRDGSQVYCGGLWFDQNEYDNLSSENLESMKQQQYDDWLIQYNESLSIDNRPTE